VATVSHWPGRVSQDRVSKDRVSEDGSIERQSVAHQFIETTAASRAADSEHPAPTSHPATTATPLSGPRRRAAFTWAATALCLALVVVLAFVFRSRVANSSHPSAAFAAQPQKSIAVLPFLDLTEGMHEEEFADGMTEELIDRLSKVPGLRVPPPTASFYFKGKLWPRSQEAPQITISDVARTLGVAYVLDGSVRKSGTTLRVDARLIRADNGYVVWSETYDRPFHDILMVQDDIAGAAAKALRVSIEAKPDH
jgi:transcriptional activator of cad operon